jgi:Flp pilus assembly protein TadG
MRSFWTLIACRTLATATGQCRKTNRECGQALIETAVTLPVLLVLLVGAVEIGRAAYASIEVSNAALAGVQYGTQNSQAAGDTTGIQTAASNDAQNITLGTTTVSHSCICSDGSASTCQPTDCAGANIETILTVQTQASFDPGFHLPGLPSSITLNGHATQKVLQ